jgi:divinyl chlorophyllide a 8-vinyl-reductase
MKSVSGQLEVIQNGAPFVMFGDGEVTRCNPIAESELAQYLIDCLTDDSRTNKILNLGGPDEPLTMKKQGEVRYLIAGYRLWTRNLSHTIMLVSHDGNIQMLFKAVGKEINFFFAPLWLFDVIIDSLQWVADTFSSEKFEDAAELGRIGESVLYCVGGMDYILLGS